MSASLRRETGFSSPASQRVDDTVPSTGSRAIDTDRDRIYRIAVAGLFGDDSRRITDRYELRNRIGAGGLGVVYRAYDARLDRDVALKFLRRASTQRYGKNSPSRWPR